MFTKKRKSKKKRIQEYTFIVFIYSSKQCWSSVSVVLLYCHLHMQHHNDTIIKTQEDFFRKYMYLSLYCKGSKRVTHGLRVRGSRRPNITVIFWPPLLWPSTLCLSHSPGLLNRRPRGPLCWVICYILSATSLGLNSIGGPEPLRPGVAFLTTSRL